jgi:hypothetical protein
VAFLNGKATMSLVLLYVPEAKMLQPVLKPRKRREQSRGASAFPALDHAIVIGGADL